MKNQVYLFQCPVRLAYTKYLEKGQEIHTESSQQSS